MKKGYNQVYTGDGKGKTTAALGLAIRAAGAGLRVRIVQFMKGQAYSELKALERFSEVLEIHQTGGTKCIHKKDVTESDKAEARRGLALARNSLREDTLDILILDEILVAHWFELVSSEEILSLMDGKSEHLELVLTGRRAPKEVIDRADLVTEMREVKHYYRQGVPARRGIES